ncbi:hypothetical protein FISHEDRAFT_5289, partial [Fistulina hepatica ATCC 64428]
DRCRSIIQYVSRKVASYIRGLREYQNDNWDGLKAVLQDTYDVERAQQPYQPRDLVSFTHKSSQGRIHNLADWKHYQREYVAIAGSLLNNHTLTEKDYNTYFWIGIPLPLRQILEHLLLIQDPKHDISEPWPAEAIDEQMKSIYNRSRFDAIIPTAEQFGIERVEEDSGSDTESDYSDDSDSDAEYRRSHQRSKKKKRRRSSSAKPRRPPPPITPPRSRTPAAATTSTKSTSQAEAVEGMIKQLNSMSINDPEYGAIYYKTLALDTTGNAAKCI